jgi:putative salt-induced outer membrane protein YdiY
VVALPAEASALADDEAWRPPEPSEDGWDWARLDTDEWIKGELISMHKEIMLFDSDKFGEVEIDWEDVVDLRLVRPRVFRRIGRRTYAGMGEIRDGMLHVLTREGEEVEFPASEVVSIVYTQEAELRNWRVRIGANLAARQGNTDQQDLTATASLRRETAFARWQTSYNGTFSRVDSDRTANNHRASTQLDSFVTRYFFVRFPGFEFYKDEFQNIEARYTPGAGLGYQPIDTRLVEFLATIGGAAQITQFENGGQDEDAAILFSSDLLFDLPRDIDLDFGYRLQLVVTDLDKTNHNTSAVMSFSVWDPIDLDVGAYWDRIERPERDGNGDRPESDDFRLTVGLSVEF